MIGCAKREYDDIIKYAFLVPLYWLAMSAAAWVAVYRLIKQPHYWSKTKHGLHLENKKTDNPDLEFIFLEASKAWGQPIPDAKKQTLRMLREEVL